MSYQSDMKDFAAQVKQRKQTTIALIKLTSLLLAVALLATTVLLVVDVLSDNGAFAPSDSTSQSLIEPVDGKTVKVRQNGTISYKSLVTYPDGYELDWNSEKVDLTTPGKYTVTYTLLQNGKTVDTMKLTVVVEEYDASKDELMQKIGAKAAELGITKDMSTEQKVRKIYDFVRGNIPYTSTSHSHTGSDRSKWETNWVKEASLTLQSMSGDCYSNYSLSKAFFEYFGIENVGIKRDENDGGLDGTHFWNVVNVGSAKAPKWYYYDSTVLKGTFSDGTKNACLITLDKLWSYHSEKVAEGNAKNTFYAFNPKNYPTVATEPLS